MGDLISRKTLLEKKIRIPIARIVTEDKIIYRDVVFVKDIEALPSAESERWSTCFDCPLSHGCSVIKGCTNEQAMQYAGEIPNDCPLNKIFAESERKKGKWLELTNTNHTYVCSVCGRMLVNISDGKNTVTKNYPFCHCGADMRGEQDDDK